MALDNNNIVTNSNAYKYDVVRLDEKFEQRLISQIPEGLNKLEIAMFIYVKLCKIFTYDEEFFLHIMGTIPQRNMSSMNHTQLSNLSRINEDNNSIVCWEFAIIYGKILKDLEIDSYVYDSELFNIKPVEVVDEEEYFAQRYGKWHPTFGIKIDDTFINFSFSAWHSDLSLAKNNYMVRDITCINETEQEKQAITDAITKAYSYLAPNESIKSSNFDAYVEEYEKSSSSVQVPLSEKMEILLEKIKESNLTGMDMLDYILLLRVLVFNSREREDNFKATMINGTYPEKGIHKPIMVFTLNDTSISNNPENNYYYIYNNGKALIPISKEELQSGFSDDRFIYFREGSRISGIKER